MEKTKILSGKWYKSLADVANKFTLDKIYKCNLNGHLLDDCYKNSSTDKLENFFIEVNMTEDYNHMSHYEKDRKISPFDVIIDWQLDFFTGTVVKYIARLGRKKSATLSPIEKSIDDINKAMVYLSREKDLLLKELDKENGQLNIKFENHG